MVVKSRVIRHYVVRILGTLKLLNHLDIIGEVEDLNSENIVSLFVTYLLLFNSFNLLQSCITLQDAHANTHVSSVSNFTRCSRAARSFASSL